MECPGISPANRFAHDYEGMSGVPKQKTFLAYFGKMFSSQYLGLYVGIPAESRIEMKINV